MAIIGRFCGGQLGPSVLAGFVADSGHISSHRNTFCTAKHHCFGRVFNADVGTAPSPYEHLGFTNAFMATVDAGKRHGLGLLWSLTKLSTVELTWRVLQEL